MSSTSVPMDNVYYVERIVNRRIDAHGQVEYYIKWLDFPDHENTWEPAANIDSKDLIEQFERNLMPSVAAAACSCMLPNISSKKRTNTFPQNYQNMSVPIEKNVGYKRNLELDEIVGVFPFRGSIFYIVHWDGLVEPDLVSSEEISLKNPKQLIEFLESRIKRQKK